MRPRIVSFASHGSLSRGKPSATIAAVVVDCRHPQAARRLHLGGLLRLGPPETSMIRLSGSARPRPQPHDEVGDVVVRLALVGVRDGEAQVVVLDVALTSSMFSSACATSAPRPVSQTTCEMWHLSGRRSRRPAGRVEVDVARRADGVVGRRIGEAAPARPASRRRSPGRSGRRRCARLDEQQHLREAVVLAGAGTARPGPRDAEDLRKSQGVRVAVGVMLAAKCFAESAGRRPLLAAPVLQLVEVCTRRGR